MRTGTSTPASSWTPATRSTSYGEAVPLPVGLLKDFEEGVIAAWHANGSGDLTGVLRPYMGAEGVGG